MSKECKGKYHGGGIKYIRDDEKYCLACQQEYDRRKQKRKEIGGISGIIGVVLAIPVAVVTILFGKKGGGGGNA